MDWTKQQLDLFEMCQRNRDNVVVRARAGSGKTSTAVEIAKKLPGAVFMAYNKAIADELQKRGCRASTIHSYAFALKPALTTVESGKLKFLHSQLKLFSPEYPLKKLVSRAKSFLPEDLPLFLRGYYKSLLERKEIRPVEDEDLLFEEAQRLYRKSLKVTSTMDFDDLLHLLLKPKYAQRVDTLIVDECQDLDNLMMKVVLNLARRVIVVGDPRQALYAFRGANSRAFEVLLKSLNVTNPMPLSYTFRCAQEIVRYANRYVPDLKAFREERGEVTLQSTDGIFDPRLGYDAYLARTNQECVYQYAYLAKMGSRPKYNGNYLKTLCETLMPYSTWEQVKAMIERIQDKLVMKPNIKLATECENLEAGLEISERLCIPLSELKNLLTLTPQNPDCLVSTIHSAKGLEWDSVHFTDTMHKPSELAMNLKYVASTRAKNRLHVVRVTPPPEA